MTTPRLIDCPNCDRPLYVDDERSRLEARPQVIALFCYVCPFTGEDVATHESGTFFRSERVACRVCSEEWVSCFPLGTDEDALECPRCHGMTGEVLEDDDELEGLE